MTLGYYCHRCKRNIPDTSKYTHEKHGKVTAITNSDAFLNPSKIKKKKDREGLPGFG